MLATLPHGTVKDGDFRINLILFKPSYQSKLRLVYFLLIALMGVRQLIWITRTTLPTEMWEVFLRKKLINSITNTTTKMPNANISCNVSETKWSTTLYTFLNFTANCITGW